MEEVIDRRGWYQLFAVLDNLQRHGHHHVD